MVDTAGQEKYKSLSKSYFKNADGVLFVFAIDDLQSFQNIREWITLFNENNSGKEGIPKYLIANKDDLENESKVNKELIDQFLKENNNQYKFKSVSALKCDKRIEELFQEIAENLYNNYKDVKQSTIQLEKNNPNKKKMKCYLCDFNY